MREMKCPFCGSKGFIRRLIVGEKVKIYDDSRSLTDEVLETIERDYSIICSQCKTDLTDEELVAD